MKLSNTLLIMAIIGWSCKENQPVKEETYRSQFSSSQEILSRYKAAEIPDTFSGYSIDFEQLIKVNKRLAISGLITINDIIKINDTYQIKATIIDLRNANSYLIELDADESIVDKIRVNNSNRFSSENALIFEVESFSKPHMTFKAIDEGEENLIQITSNDSFILKGKAIDYVLNK